MVICPNCHSEMPNDAKFCSNCATKLPRTSSNSLVGKRINNKYIVTRKLAEGGMGEVYLAKQEALGQEVAIKKLHAELCRDQTLVDRFITEARAYGKISHPNAVKVHDLLNVNGELCIIMEYVKGETLTSYLEKGHCFSTRQIINIGMQIADALATAHEAGIIHRDLKTENIMLQETVPGKFSAKILDFGIAKVQNAPTDGKTKEGMILGTPEFMSPEQCYGAKDIDGRTDIYSYGIILYVMVANCLPFRSETKLGTLGKQINMAPPALIRPDGKAPSSDLEALIMKCLEKKPEDRYQRFADVITDLEHIQDGEPLEFAHSVGAGTGLSTPNAGPCALNDALESSKTEISVIPKLRAAEPVKISTSKSLLLEDDPDGEIDDDSSIGLRAVERIESSGTLIAKRDTRPADEDRSIDVDLSIDVDDSELSIEPVMAVEAPHKVEVEDKPVNANQSSNEVKPMESKDSLIQMTIVSDEKDESGDLKLGEYAGEFSCANLSLGKIEGDVSLTGLKLGAMDGTDGPDESVVVPKKRSSKAPIVVLLLLIAAAGVVYVFGDELGLSSLLGSSTAVDEPAVAQADAPAPVVADAPVPVVAEAPVAPAEPVVETPSYPPCEAMTQAALVRGIWRASLATVGDKLNAGDLDKAKAQLTEIEAKLVEASDADKALIAELNQKYELCVTALDTATKAKKDMECGSIKSVLDTVPVEAKGVRSKIEKLHKSCARDVEAPPALLD